MKKLNSPKNLKGFNYLQHKNINQELLQEGIDKKLKWSNIKKLGTLIHSRTGSYNSKKLGEAMGLFDKRLVLTD